MQSYPYRTRRLKYLAGTELAAGMFANDALPEEKAKELQAVSVTFESRSVMNQLSEEVPASWS